MFEDIYRVLRHSIADARCKYHKKYFKRGCKECKDNQEIIELSRSVIKTLKGTEKRYG